MPQPTVLGGGGQRVALVTSTSMGGYNESSLIDIAGRHAADMSPTYPAKCAKKNEKFWARSRREVGEKQARSSQKLSQILTEELLILGIW